MMEKCNYMRKNIERKEFNCVITGKYCVAAIDAAGEIDKTHEYMAKVAEFCPAYNIEKQMAKSLQSVNLDRQKSELEKLLEN